MLTWKEVKERQALGETLRWVPKKVSGLPILCDICKKLASLPEGPEKRNLERQQRHMLHSGCDVRDLFLGKQRLSDSEEHAFGGGMQSTGPDGSIILH